MGSKEAKGWDLEEGFQQLSLCLGSFKNPFPGLTPPASNMFQHLAKHYAAQLDHPYGGEDITLDELYAVTNWDGRQMEAVYLELATAAERATKNHSDRFVNGYRNGNELRELLMYLRGGYGPTERLIKSLPPHLVRELHDRVSKLK